MRYADGTYDMTVDDIYEIRERNSKLFETMTKEEVINYINDGANKLGKVLKNEKDLVLD